MDHLIKSIDECHPWLIVSMQEAVVVLVKGWSSRHIVGESLEGEVQSVFVTELPEMTVES